MKRTKFLKKLFLSALIIIILYAFYYCWISFPVATGYGAKVLCSAIFLSGRNETEVKAQELEFTPLNLAAYEVNYKDSSVSCSLFGFAERKAIFRSGLGATLVNELSEQQIRTQNFRLAIPEFLNIDTIPWPMGDRVADSLPSSIDIEKLTDAVNEFFLETDTSDPIRTRALVVIYDNQIVAERYARDLRKVHD